MYYLFLGIAYLADLFMASVEMITSTKKEVIIKDDKGQDQTIVVRIWNQTVANLTLIALGCAAPEVLLSCIEIVKNNFEAEELGPSETVASASFNLFAIIGVCIYVIPRNESRKIKYLSVFIITAIWSLFAYLWLLLITNFISPGIIEIWEAVVTLCFFPLTVISAFLADKKSVMSSKDKTYRIHHGIIVETMQSSVDPIAEVPSRQFLKQFSIETRNQDIQQFEEHRRELIVTMKNLRRMDPTMNANQLELMAVSQLLDNGAKNNAHFHIKASKKLTGLSSWRIRQESKRTDIDFSHYYHQSNSNASTSAPNTPSRSNDRRITEVFFSPGHYTVDEGVGMFTATVVRQNGDLNRQVLVDYATEDGDAVAGKDYGEVRGTLCFQPGQTRKTIEIPIIDDIVYEGDQHFYIRLFNLRFGQVRGRDAEKGLINPDAYSIPAVSSDQIIGRRSKLSSNDEPSSGHSSESTESTLPESDSSVAKNDLRLACPALATVMILDDDHHGIFTLAKREINVSESSGTVSVQILRTGGNRGRVALTYQTEEGTAEADKDFLPRHGQLIFEDGEIE
jgi:solute carrier family 8 (sodium/calcium exchanger)